MQNDAKLGFLAGVAGVVASAVLFTQNQPPAAPVARAAPAAVVATRPAGAAVAAGSADVPAAVARADAPAARVAPTGRKELGGRTVSRATSGDE